jgi:hypothetical protein
MMPEDHFTLALSKSQAAVNNLGEKRTLPIANVVNFIKRPFLANGGHSPAGISNVDVVSAHVDHALHWSPHLQLLHHIVQGVSLAVASIRPTVDIA